MLSTGNYFHQYQHQQIKTEPGATMFIDQTSERGRLDNT